MSHSLSTGRHALLVFARCPEPGRVKTRLTPALGADRACRLHAALTQRTLAAAAEWSAQPARLEPPGREVQVWLTGGSGGDRQRLVEPWGFALADQSSGDLGERLAHATATAFASGYRRLVVVGTDCPELSASRLAEAFVALDRADIVLGPALDGGYYLIGLRQPEPELFRGIAWGTDRVLAETTARCRSLGRRFQLLPALSDVDYPEDLLVCRRLGGALAEPIVLNSVAPQLSVIIPTLNEASNIEATLEPLVGQPGIEVIVADGGSRDDTMSRAAACGAMVISTSKGRGPQQNAGAAVANGEVLLFLHADTRLPTDFRIQIERVLASGAVAGAFPLGIADPQASLRWVEWGANLRSRYGQLPYGDQAIFVPASRFYAVGGFPNWPLMEDVELCRRLRRHGRIGLASTAVQTSARRWQRLGVWRTTFVNQLVFFAYRAGISPHRLAEWYRGAAK